MKATAGCFTLGLLLMVSPGGYEGRGRQPMGLGPLVAKRRASFVMRTSSAKTRPAVERTTPVAETRRLTPAPVPAVDLIGRLKDIFASEGIPTELVWVAEVESALDPKARSAAGARGLFQFMPATARRFGLTVSGGRDERLDPAKSARAAARYLRFLYSEFGSWPLALAAYNAGEGRVSRELGRERAWAFDQICQRLPAQTRQYVPRVMNIISWEEGLGPGEIGPPRT